MTIDKTILGGAKRSGFHKPRGFIDSWNPRADTRKLLDQVQAVLDEYRTHLPLTLRQVFYRLVGAYGYPKTERAYSNLSEILNKARRARIIEMDAIRDDGLTRDELKSYEGVEDFLQTMRKRAELYRRNRSEGQPDRLMLWCEASGMVPQLARVARHYGVPVLSSGGFDSTTAKYDFAEEIAECDRPVVVLHIGDHDPSGTHLALNLTEDVTAFVEELGGEVTFHRLAVTPKQISELGLPTAPRKVDARTGKLKDNRAFKGETCQAEAIAPDDLARIVREAIENHTDRRILDRVLKREKHDRAALIKRLMPSSR